MSRRRRRIGGGMGRAAGLASGVTLLLDSTDESSMTKSWSAITQTGAGTIGTTVITASATVANVIEAGMRLRIGATEVVTVASVVTTTINIVENLSATYAALTALYLERVSQWNDKSGNGYHVTQSVELRRPVFNPTGKNGKGTLFFNGSNNFVLPSGLYTIPNGNSVWFSVAKRNSETGGSNRIISMTEGGSTRLRQDYMATAGNVGFLSRTATTGGVAYAGSTNTNFNVLRGRRNGTTLASTVNNNTEVTSADGASEAGVDAGTIGAFLDGGTLGFFGTIGSIVAYNSAISAAEYVKTGRWLGRLFDITIV